MLRTVLLALLICGSMHEVLCCNGFKVRVISIKNCVADPVIGVGQNFTSIIDRNCGVIPQGCIQSKGFSKAKVTYTVTKNDVLVKKGDADLCKEMDSASQDARALLNIFGLPSKCPVQKGEVCGSDKRGDINNYKKYLNVARGIIHVTANIAHDTGASCLKLKFEIAK